MHSWLKNRKKASVKSRVSAEETNKNKILPLSFRELESRRGLARRGRRVLGRSSEYIKCDATTMDVELTKVTYLLAVSSFACRRMWPLVFSSLSPVSALKALISAFLIIA